jgi:hypothetical protein
MRAKNARIIHTFILTEILHLYACIFTSSFLFLFRMCSPKTWAQTLRQGFSFIATEDRLFYPVILGPLYLLLGPWAVGFFLKDSLGLLFFWGLYTDSQLLPATAAVAYALIHVVPFLCLFLLYTAVYSGKRHGSQSSRKTETFAFNVLFWTFMSVQLVLAGQIYKQLGLLESLGVLGATKLAYFYFVWRRTLPYT